MCSLTSPALFPTCSRASYALRSVVLLRALVLHLPCTLGALVLFVRPSLQVYYAQYTLMHFVPRSALVSLLLCFHVLTILVVFPVSTTVNHYDMQPVLTQSHAIVL